MLVKRYSRRVRRYALEGRVTVKELLVRRKVLVREVLLIGRELIVGKKILLCKNVQIGRVVLV